MISKFQKGWVLIWFAWPSYVHIIDNGGSNRQVICTKMFRSRREKWSPKGGQKCAGRHLPDIKAKQSPFTPLTNKSASLSVPIYLLFYFWVLFVFSLPATSGTWPRTWPQLYRERAHPSNSIKMFIIWNDTASWLVGCLRWSHNLSSWIKTCVYFHKGCDPWNEKKNIWNSFEITFNFFAKQKSWMGHE